MSGRTLIKLDKWPVRFLRPAFFLLVLTVAACSTDLPVEPEKSSYSGAGIIILEKGTKIHSITFDPTFVGETRVRQIDVEYGDTIKTDMIIRAKDSQDPTSLTDSLDSRYASASDIFTVPADTIHFSKQNKKKTISITFQPEKPGTVYLGYLYLVTFVWLDSLKTMADTLGIDLLKLSGVGQGFYLDMDLVFIPGGNFLMGIDSASASADFQYQDEWPAHQVTLSDFFIGRYEVTNMQYYEFWMEDSTGHTPRDTSDIGYWPYLAFKNPNHPVIGVNWKDAMSFCQWLSLRTGDRYTLPTEAQWEYVAAGGDSANIYPWSSDTVRSKLGTGALANTRQGGDGYTYTAPVDAFPDGASKFGPFNMAGNVWEWCVDWYDPEYYRREGPWVDPQGSTDLEHQLYKVIRGGSWLEPLTQATCRNRGALNPDNREIDVGFRIVRLP